MARERIVKATFSTGLVLERGSVSKVYTHAYNIDGKYGDQGHHAGKSWGYSGFSTSKDQCERNMRGESAWCRKQPGSTVTSEEVVAVEVVEKRSAPPVVEALS